MTKMNRFFSMMTAMTMVAASMVSVNAFADEETSAETTVVKPAVDMHDKSAEVTGFTETDLDVTVDADREGTLDDTLYSDNADGVEQEIKDIAKKESEPKVYVEVSWEELKFVYDFGTVDYYDWDITTCEYIPVYKYENKEGRAWIDNDAEITFTNFSNRDVYVGVSFEMDKELKGKGEVYENVTVSFDKQEDLILSAVRRGLDNLDQKVFTMTVSGEPVDVGDMPALGELKFYISEEARVKPDEAPAAETTETPSGDHEHHYVYDQFGRLVCTGCNAVKHEYCIDEDEDGLCDECGLERDFCPDCHIGGTCRCI